MSESMNNKGSEQIPTIQKQFDRPFLWLIVGMVTILVFYTFWGIYEIFSLPKALLP